MAAPNIIVKVGNKLVVKNVHDGTKQDGTAWQQVHITDEEGKIEAGLFMDPPIPGLREGDTIEVDSMQIIAKRVANRHAYNTKTWQKIDNPMKFITENTPQITAHMANKKVFTGGGVDEPGFENLDDMDGELPF